MEWRIRQNDNGGWVAEKGIKVESHPNPNGIGYKKVCVTMAQTFF